MNIMASNLSIRQGALHGDDMAIRISKIHRRSLVDVGFTLSLASFVAEWIKNLLSFFESAQRIGDVNPIKEQEPIRVSIFLLQV